jgi:hypothetical protein
MIRQPRFDVLEGRMLLAANVAFQPAIGELLIQGTPNADFVTVYHKAKWLMVEVQEGAAAVIQFTLNPSGVRTIRFEGRDGDDSFRNNTNFPSIAYGNQGNDVLGGGTANDDLRGGPGNDRLDGNAGDDQLHGDYGNDSLDGGDGDDDVRGWFGDDDLRGGAGNDYVSGYEGDDLVFGGLGHDVLKGHEGHDKLYGQDGNDQLFGWEGDDYLMGGSGDDYLSGWSGSDVLLGGDGNDELNGHAGRDLLIGGAGADILDGGSSEDIIVAGSLKFSDDSKLLARILAAWNVDEALRSAPVRGVPPLSVHTVAHDGNTDTIVRDPLAVDWLLIERIDIQTGP